jgi:hypothetical protein
VLKAAAQHKRIMLSLQRRQAVSAGLAVYVFACSTWTAGSSAIAVYAGMPAGIFHCVPGAPGLWAWQARCCPQEQDHTNTNQQ